MSENEPIRKIRVLIVEDRATDAELVVRQLRRSGFDPEWRRVETAADYLSALESAPEVILSDFHMPRFDAPTALRLLQERGLDIPFIIISGTIGEEAAVASMKAGATDYLLKDRLARLGPAVTRAMEDKVLRDERRRAGQALLESEERFRQLAENITQVFWMTDVAKNQMLYISPAYETIWGRTCESLLKSPRDWLTAIHPEDRTRVLEAATTKQVLGNYDETYRILRPDGSLRWIRDRAFPIRNSAGEIYRIVGTAEDITERKRAAEELRLTHEQLRRVLEYSPAVIYSLKVEGQRVTPHVVSENITRLLGFTVAESLSFEWWEARLHVEDRERALASIPETLKLGSLTIEYRVRHQDGHDIWVEDNRRVVRDAGGHPVEITGSWTDVTERKRAEDALRQSEARFSTVFHASPLPSAITRISDGKVLEANGHLCAFFGLPREEVVGRTTRELKLWPRPEDRARVVEQVQRDRAIQGLEARFCDGSGQVRDVVLYLALIELPTEADPVIIWKFSDITERKETEMRLAAQHAVTLALSDAAPLPETAKRILRVLCQDLNWDVGEFWVLNRGGRELRCLEIFHRASARFEQFAQASRRTTCARSVGLPGRVWDANQPVSIEDLSEDKNFRRTPEALRAGLSSAVAFPVAIRDEFIGVLAFFGARFRAPDDKLLAMFTAIGSQIAQFVKRAQLEEQFRQAQKMEAIGQLAGGVAHDFNNILTVINGYSGMLLDREGLDREMMESLQQIHTSGERAANLNRQLLAFSRRQEIHPELLDLGQVVTDISKMLRRIVGENFELLVNPSPGIPLIEADAGMMEQVVMNLVVNARDAMPKSGRILISLAAATVSAAEAESKPETRAGSFVLLQVEDTGCGIPPENIPHIYEPFFTTKEVGRGTGLGLATVFGIVKQHRGWIEVESQVGIGTTFKIYLPVAARPNLAPAPKQAIPSAGGGKETILLVEDEEAVRSLAILVLNRHGYRVLEAASPDEALKVWERHSTRIDLLLSDMVMPGDMTGRNLADRLRALKPGLKVILASGYSSGAAGHAAARDSATPFLQKPYAPRVLAQTVRKVLDEPAQAKKEGG
jgi:PAS domain S-box-containing protein